MRYLLLLLLAGCQPDNERKLMLRNYSDENTQLLKDPKPVQFEIIDEYGIKKGWRF